MNPRLPLTEFALHDELIQWHCAECSKPVNPGSGFLGVDHNRVEDVREARGALSGHTSFNYTELLQYPESANWHVYHFDCDPNKGGNEYTIEVERISSLPQVIAWTAQLMEKTWLNATDWSHLLRRLGGTSL